MSRVLCQLSGGFDSVSATLLVAETGVEFSTIFFNIKQPYFKEELRAVEYVVDFLRKYPNYIEHKQVDAPVAFNVINSSLPEEYIPIRNLVLGAISMNISFAEGYTEISVGNKTIEVRQDDPYSFADCSVDFYKRMGDLGTYASQGSLVKFIMPLVNETTKTSLSKEQVIGVCIENGIDVSKIWSCYTPGESYCGNCHHCQEIRQTKYSHFFFN